MRKGSWKTENPISADDFLGRGFVKSGLRFKMRKEVQRLRRLDVEAICTLESDPLFRTDSCTCTQGSGSETSKLLF